MVIDDLKKLAEKSRSKGPQLLTEEATKQALVLPFIRALGYDVFDSDEVVPEFVATGSDKKDQRADYAIMLDGEPVILIECKAYGTPLAQGQADQLRKYFNFVKSARVGILTDGNIYKLYTDLDDENILDKTPYVEISLEQLDMRLVPELQKLEKGTFSPGNVTEAAKRLKYSGAFKTIFQANLATPDDDLVRFFLRRADFPFNVTTKAIEEFRPVLKEAMDRLFNDRMNERFQAMMQKEEEEKEPEKTAEQPSAPDSEPQSEIVTTDEEKEAFYIVKTILHGVAPHDKVNLKDFKSFCNVVYDNSLRKLIVRFFFNESGLSIGLPEGEGGSIVREKIDSIEGLYAFADRIRSITEKYVQD